MDRWNHDRTSRVVRIVAVVFALMTISLTGVSAQDATPGSAAAADRIDWIETNYQENVLVEQCGGYDITSSYTAEIAHHLISDNAGDEVAEQLNVDFVGALGNAATGKAYQYDGHFTRWSNYIQNRVIIADLELRFGVDAPSQFTIAIDRVEMDLLADPTEVIKKFVPNALQMELCYLLARPGAAPAPQVASYQERMASAPASQVASYQERLTTDPPVKQSVSSYEERIFSDPLTADEVADEMTHWTELDPCDSSPPGKLC